MPLTGIHADVTQAMVKGLLQQRQPDILDEDLADQLPVFEARVRGAAVEVVLLTGLDPIPGMVRDLATEAIALQTGSEIEYAEYPEQQAQGDVGRGYHLHQRFLELLARLARIINDAGGKVPTDDEINRVTSVRPRGRFPSMQAYPDPVQVPAWRRYS